MHLFLRSSARKLTSSEEEAVTAESSAQQPDVRDVWDGLTVVASKYGCRMQGTTDVAFTVLDVLGYLDEIPVCVGYEIDGKVTTEFPTTRTAGESKTGSEDTSGMEMRYPRNQEIRRSSGKLP